eukprot:403341130
MKEAFTRWRRGTRFVSTAAKNIAITSNALIQSQQDKIENLKKVLKKRQQELEFLKNQHQQVELDGKIDFTEKVQTLRRLIKRQAIYKVVNLIKTKALRTPFELIKASNEYAYYKHKLMRDLPKPRKKQWWEKLMEEEYDYFYEKAGEKLKKVPVCYRDLYEFILEHRLIKQVIQIQRFIRKRNMRRWLIEHNVEDQDTGQNQNNNNEQGNFERRNRLTRNSQNQPQNQRRTVKVDVSFLESKGQKERGNMECNIY